MTKNYSNTGYSHWFLFLISPFLAGIIAIKNYRYSWSKNILWAFVVFFGLTFGYAIEANTGKATADISRSITAVEGMYKRNLSIDQIKEYYTKNKDIDVLQLTIFIVVSRFTDSAKILIPVYGFIFGFFFSRNIWFVLNRLKGKIQPITILLLIVFCLVNPFWNINGFRFYTATHIFIYGLLPFLFEGKKKGVLISALSILVHFSFLLPVACLLVYILLGNRIIIYFIFFLASFITTAINIASFNKLVEAQVPKALSERTSNYRSERYVKDFRERAENYVQKSSWHAVLYIKALEWSLIAFMVFLFFKRKFLNQLNPRFLSSLSFALLFWGVANILRSLPSGERYLAIALLSILPLIIFYVHYQYNEKYVRNLSRLIVPALLLFIIVSVRTGFYSLTINTFIGNPLVAIFADYNFSLNDLIK